MLRLLKDLYIQSRLLTSNLFNEKTFHKSFYRDLRRARRSILIESPYLTERRVAYYAPLFKELTKNKVKIRVNTRHPRYHEGQMKTQAEKATAVLLEAGVQIYTYNDFRHWKLAIIDKTILWEGSLNILSHGRSREVMRRSISSYLCHKMIDFVKICY